MKTNSILHAVELCRLNHLVDESSSEEYRQTGLSKQEVYSNPNIHYLQAWFSEKHHGMHKTPDVEVDGLQEKNRNQVPLVSAVIWAPRLSQVQAHPNWPVGTRLDKDFV